MENIIQDCVFVHHYCNNFICNMATLYVFLAFSTGTYQHFSLMIVYHEIYLSFPTLCPSLMQLLYLDALKNFLMSNYIEPAYKTFHNWILYEIIISLSQTKLCIEICYTLQEIQLNLSIMLVSFIILHLLKYSEMKINVLL